MSMVAHIKQILPSLTVHVLCREQPPHPIDCYFSFRAEIRDFNHHLGICCPTAVWNVPRPLCIRLRLDNSRVRCSTCRHDSLPFILWHIAAPPPGLHVNTEREDKNKEKKKLKKKIIIHRRQAVIAQCAFPHFKSLSPLECPFPIKPPPLAMVQLMRRAALRASRGESI